MSTEYLERTILDSKDEQVGSFSHSLPY